MARLILSAVVEAPPEDVYRLVTVYGSDGPVSKDAFLAKYGRIVSKEGKTYTCEEDSEDRIRWRVRFEPPTLRVMEAIDSLWSDRVDLFRESPRGTRWMVIWQSKVGGVRGALQFLVFHLFHKARIRRAIIQPVVDNFRSYQEVNE